jgi:hypothetical protein
LLGAGAVSTILPVERDPPHPITVLRGFLLGALALAGVGAVVVAVDTGDVPERLLALVAFLWIAGTFAERLYAAVLAPLGRFLSGALAGSGPAITLDDEIRDLEARVADEDVTAERRILAGIRLAEIYRKYRHDRPRAEALLDRLIARFPDAQELQVARRHPA